MAILKKYDLFGVELGQEHIDERLLKKDANSQMIKDYLVAIRNNGRQWSANTKGRSEVNHSGQKPHPQKGTGRARQGFLGSPQYKGGGRVFTPKPKFDQHVRINRKEKKSAIAALLTEKMIASHVHILNHESLKEAKTKVIANFLKVRGSEGKRILFLGANSQEGSEDMMLTHFMHSIRNIPYLNFRYISQISGYDVALNTEIYIMDAALEQFIGLMEKSVVNEKVAV